ncbi:hypothetical protein [Paenibacillus sp. FSL M8-0212]|uniref:hypothetical protein n=1 Tax=Paenibacillus TaxID=44249 RepID=UPI0030F6DE83
MENNKREPHGRRKETNRKKRKREINCAKGKTQIIDEMEAHEVVDALYKETRKWRLLILGSMLGGFSRGELNGLEWPEVLFDNNAIRIKNNIPLTLKGLPVKKDRSL